MGNCMTYIEGDLMYDRKYFVGVDLGQAHDPTAICVVEKDTYHVADTVIYRFKPDPIVPPPQYRIRYLERLPLGMAYPQQVLHVVQMLNREPLASAVPSTYVDHTGVGRAVFDLFKQTRVQRLYPVTITGGQEITRANGGWNVSKTELISKVQALLHSRRLTIEPELADAAALVRELQDFRVSFSSAGNAIFGAREGAHDDLVLAAALAVFGASHVVPKTGAEILRL